MDQIKEFDTDLNCKRVAQSIKVTAKDLEKLPRSGIIIEATRIKVRVPDTRYTIVYKVINNPTHKLIAKKILRHK